MLSELRISGLGVIDEAVVEPHPGFTVVTGETGAGKTMVVTALGLAAGGRGDADRVRAGAGRAVVETRWQVDPQTQVGRDLAEAVAAAGGDTDDDGSVICVRSITDQGRSRAHVGGRSAPLSVLAGITEPLLTVHGQSEAISLLRPAAQREVLDRSAGCGPLLQDYRRARQRWQDAVTELADRRSRARDLAQREQVLRMGLAEIEAVDPQPGEDAALVDSVKRLENVDGLRAAAGAAAAALAGLDVTDDAPTAVALVEQARRNLVGSGDPRLADWEQPLQQALSVLTEIGADLSGYLEALDADPALLEQTLHRQAQLRGLTRRYGADADAVLDWAAKARAELASLDTSDQALAALQQRVDELAADTAAAAGKLTAARTAAAERLGAAATDELRQLAMGTAQVRVDVSARLATEDGPDTLAVGTGRRRRRVHAGPDGTDQVEILMTPRPGAPELPIAKGASGGELSRVMLALEAVLADADTVGTLVFDEVDAGVGGRAATEIGRRLAALARSHQVIVVTHLAQVAAFADRQYVVQSAVAGDVPTGRTADRTIGAAAVRVVDGEQRRAELARMLGGTDTDAALAHADDLLAAAVATRR